MKRQKRYVIVIGIVLILAAFAAGIYVAPAFNPEIASAVEQTEERQSTAGLLPANISIDRTAVFLTHACRTVTFEVTEDQAFSISHGIEGSVSTRPLTHDIFRDVLDNFAIKVLQIKIDRFEDDVYKAKMVLKQGDKILEIDMRPSDAIALATRMGRILYVSEDVMNTRSIKVC
ncbi:MAG: bifunctional nuclease family protein [Candidatus Aenigmarchaeota archaeon]|nr:bifunctional nuclease family protein [Candidatus Aenigmarchaeota archaeon]